MKSSHNYLSLNRVLLVFTTIFILGLIAPQESFGQTYNTLTLSWTSPGDDGSAGTATTYDVRYSTALITEANFNAATQAINEPTPQIAGSTELFVIDSLEPSTTYYFAIKSSDEALNWSTISNVITKTTSAAPDTIPPAAVIDLSALTGEINGTILLNWTAPGDNSLSGTVAVYEIRYSQNLITNSNWSETSLLITPPPPLPAGEFQTYTLTGLTPGQVYYTALKSYDSTGNVSTISNIVSAEAAFNLSTDIDDTDNNLPTEFALSQNFPNPFNPSTTIGFSLPTASFVELSIYNIEGKKVKTLVEQNLSAGQHNIEWDGTNNSGSQIATGMYIYRMTTETFSTSKKMVLLK